MCLLFIFTDGCKAFRKLGDPEISKAVSMPFIDESHLGAAFLARFAAGCLPALASWPPLASLLALLSVPLTFETPERYTALLVHPIR